MGKVKEHFHDEICNRAAREAGEEPDDLELLRMDMEQSRERYLSAMLTKEAGNERASHNKR